MTKELRVGFDAKRVFQNFTGLGNYSRTLLLDLSKHKPALSLNLFAPKKIERERTAAFLNDPFNCHFPNTIFKSSWRSKGMVKDLLREKIDVYHGLSHEIPLGIEKTNIPSVVSMHDLIIKADPKQFNWVDRKIYQAKFKSSCKRATKIVAISESTKKDLIKHFSIAAEKIEVIYQTCHDQFKTLSDSTLTKQFLATNNLPNEYLLYVGSAIQRKNLLGLVQAYSQLPTEIQIPLLVVCGESAYKDKVQALIEKLRLADKVIFLNDFQFSNLPYLYRGASLLCYPSLYEGFGLPIIESLFQKTAVLTGNNSSLPEASGPGAILIDAKQEEDILRGLTMLLESADLRSKLANLGFDYVQKFNSKVICNQWQTLYQGLVGR